MALLALSRMLATLMFVVLLVWGGVLRPQPDGQSAWAAAREFPTDREMIDEFQTYRGDFERLVALYQKHGSHGRLQRGQQEYDEYTTLLKRRGLSHLSGDGATWLPDPYSAETAKRRPRGADFFHAFAHHGVFLHVEKVTISARLHGGPPMNRDGSSVKRVSFPLSTISRRNGFGTHPG